MSFRNYLGKINIFNSDDLRFCTFDLAKRHFSDENVDANHIPIITTFNKIFDNIFECGKCFPNIDMLTSEHISPFFKDKSLDKYFNEDMSQCVILNKDGLAFLINGLKKHIVDFLIDDYSKIISELQNNKYSKLTSENIGNIINMYRNRITEFHPDFEMPKQLIGKIKGNFDLNKPNQITNSTLYEYSIFELIFIYKTFDWNNDYLILYGY